MAIDTPIQVGGRTVDLSQRIAWSTTVVASPALAAETIIGSVTIPGGLGITAGVLLVGFAPITVGTSGVSVQLRIRQTDVNGTVVGNSGALTATAADLYAPLVWGVDASPGDGQLYKLTAQVASGAAASTVSAILFAAFAI